VNIAGSLALFFVLDDVYLPAFAHDRPRLRLAIALGGGLLGAALRETVRELRSSPNTPQGTRSEGKGLE
jgi:hypothetical protein